MVVGLLAAAHAFNYGRWLMKQGNKFGGFAVYVVVALCAVMPLYRLMTAR